MAVIFGGRQPQEETPSRGTNGPSALSKAALATYRKAQQAAQAGNWAEYGRLLRELEKILQQLNQT